MTKHGIMILAGALSLAGPVAAAGYGDGGRCQAAAFEAVEKSGIARSDITDIQTVTIHTTDDGPTDVQAWMTVKQCPQGNVVVQMTPACYVEDVYTRGGCRIEGVPAY